MESWSATPACKASKVLHHSPLIIYVVYKYYIFNQIISSSNYSHMIPCSNSSSHLQNASFPTAAPPYHLEHWLLFLVVMPCKYSILFWVLFYLHFYFPQNRHNSANYHACDHCDAGICLSHAFIPLTVICVRRRKARYVQPTNHLFTRLHAPGNIYFQTSKRFDKKYFTTKLINEPTKTWNNSSKQNEVMDIIRGKIVL